MAPDPPRDDGIPAEIYRDLRRLAGAYMRRERGAHTLQPTALVHEAYLKLAESGVDAAADRLRLLAFAARAMRQILVDHARARNAAKRGGGRRRLTLHGDLAVVPSSEAIDVLDLHEALDELARLDARKSRVVELRFFAGLSLREVATVLHVSDTTAEDDWYTARAWLRRRLDLTPP